MVAGGAVPAPVSSRVKRVAETIRQTLAQAAESRAWQPGRVLGHGNGHRLSTGGDPWLHQAAAAVGGSRPIENGKTSLMLLIDQLDLLGATMDEIFDAVVRVDADALIAHGRFLQEKFGQASTGGMLNLGDPPVQQPRSNLDLP